jgi:RNA 2',3'-cyclic 3'-phosphodiesterase
MPAGTSRVFFALWPDKGTREKLQAESLRLHQLVGGRVTHPDTLHLTLVFIGEVENGQMEAIGHAASQASSASFDLNFDRVECWRHNHIAHLGVCQPPEALFHLVGTLSAGLRDAGIAFDARSYVPHITLVRKADCKRFGHANENPALLPIFWPARDFVLVRSSLRPEGARYELVGRWPLL